MQSQLQQIDLVDKHSADHEKDQVMSQLEFRADTVS